MIIRQTSISKNIVHFCRYLRYHGFTIGVEEEATLLNALECIDFNSQKVLKLALQTVVCKSLKELVEFDRLFDTYWKELAMAIDSKVDSKAKPLPHRATKGTTFKALKSWLNGNKNSDIEVTAAYSTNESLSQKDFSLVHGDEMKELIQSIKSLSRRLANQLHQRYEKTHKINAPDLKRTLRNNMRHGGELLEIAYRKTKRNRAKLVVLCDVSKSMDLYSSFFLQFMYAFQQVYRKVETFAFGTRLECITGYLKQQDFRSALKSLDGAIDSWSGGTKIGASLHEFVEVHAATVLDKRTTVIILSDGWDTGEIDLLRESMEIIHKRARKVIWLNPLAGYEHYHPEVAGMRAALKYVDVFAAVHNLDSLRKLSKLL